MPYHRARYYHPQLRRFLNQDTVLGSITTHAGLNRFAYANGNPVTGIDPFGLYNVGTAKDDGANTVVTNGSGGLEIRLGKNPLDTSQYVINSIKIHEGVHLLDALNQNNAIGSDKDGKPQPAGLFLKPDTLREQLFGEMDASQRQNDYLNKVLADPGLSEFDRQQVLRESKFVQSYYDAAANEFRYANSETLNGPPVRFFVQLPAQKNRCQ
jgi:hypothetical protein